jgi:hypothetical protein
MGRIAAGIQAASPGSQMSQGEQPVPGGIGRLEGLGSDLVTPALERVVHPAGFMGQVFLARLGATRGGSSGIFG